MKERERNMDKIRVLIADDHKMMREGLKSLFEDEEQLDVVAEAANGEDTVRLARSCGVHLVIMDVSMPDLNGIEATRQIIAQNPNTDVIALSGYANKEYV